MLDLAADPAVFRGGLLSACRSGYVVLEAGQTQIADVDAARFPGMCLTGRPTVFGATLYSAQRPSGTVRAVGISNPRDPVLRWSLEVEGNPGPAMGKNGGALALPATAG